MLLLLCLVGLVAGNTLPKANLIEDPADGLAIQKLKIASPDLDGGFAVDNEDSSEEEEPKTVSSSFFEGTNRGRRFPGGRGESGRGGSDDKGAELSAALRKCRSNDCKKQELGNLLSGGLGGRSDRPSSLSVGGPASKFRSIPPCHWEVIWALWNVLDNSPYISSWLAWKIMVALISSL